MKHTTSLFVLLATIIGLPMASADEPVPLNAVTPETRNVVYDVAIEFHQPFKRLLDRVSKLSHQLADDPNRKGSIVLVLHGPEIRYFATKDYPRYKEIADQALALSNYGIARFRVCQETAEARGLHAEDLLDFVQLVPLGEAEIIRLQRAGYAYLR